MSRRVFFLQGPTELLNPTVDRGIIEAAFEDDTVSARAEWGGEFRADVSQYLSDEVVDRAIRPGERSRAREAIFEYVAFVDAAGGSGADAMTCAIAHQDRGKVFVDQLIAIDPPFDTEVAVERCSLLMKSFGLSSARADRYAGDWPAQAFRRHGISIHHSDLDKAAIYRECSPLFMSGLVSLIDDQRLEVELRCLERAPRSGGRADMIDHAPGRGSHDDRINAVAGALLMASKLPMGGRSAMSMPAYQQPHRSRDYDPWDRHDEEERRLHG